MLAAAFLERAFGGLARRAQRDFLFDGAQRISADVFLSTVKRRQEQLAGLGFASGHRLLIPAGRRGLYWVDLLAVLGLGGVVVPLASDVSPAHLAHILARAQPWGMAAPKAPEGLVALSDLEWQQGGENARPGIAAQSDSDLTAILFTSGTTGEPKGVMLSGRSLYGNATATLERIRLGEGDNLFFALAHHFTSAICHFLAALASGAALSAIDAKLMSGDFLRLLRESDATCLGGPPLHLRWLSEAEQDVASRLRWAMSSGDHLGEDVVAALKQKRPGVDIYAFYGLTELGGRFCMLPPGEITAHPGSVGSPIPGLRLTIHDDDMNLVPPGQLGEVVADGDYLFDGYINDPGATRAALCPFGLRTGDLGRQDDDGRLYLFGRTDDVFKCNGQKVSGLVLGEALMNTGLLMDAAVVAESHAVAGHVPHALVVAKDGIDVNRGLLVRQLRDQLPAYYLPHKVTVVSSLPRSGTGKLLRKEVRKLAGHIPA
jgi:fatty-acyl-CoA synthase